MAKATSKTGSHQATDPKTAATANAEGGDTKSTGTGSAEALQEQLKQAAADKAALEETVKAKDAEIADLKTKLQEAETAKTAAKAKAADTSGAAAEMKLPEGTKTVVIASADRRRAGRSFAKGQAVPIDPDELDEDELKAIEDDPVLTIKPV